MMTKISEILSDVIVAEPKLYLTRECSDGRQWTANLWQKLNFDKSLVLFV